MEAISLKNEEVVALVRGLVGSAAWERQGAKWRHRINTGQDRVCAAVVLLAEAHLRGLQIGNQEAYLERCWISAEGRLHRIKGNSLSGRA